VPVKSALQPQEPEKHASRATSSCPGRADSSGSRRAFSPTSWPNSPHCWRPTSVERWWGPSDKGCAGPSTASRTSVTCTEYPAKPPASQSPDHRLGSLSDPEGRGRVSRSPLCRQNHESKPRFAQELGMSLRRAGPFPNNLKGCKTGAIVFQGSTDLQQRKPRL
jgi:hypothetical protein